MSVEFTRQITEHQQRLYGYIHSLTGNSATSWDILQETNIVLWKKKDEFRPGSKFDAWAFTVARFQVLAFLRDRKREPLSLLTPELLESFADDAELVAERYDERLTALQRCRAKLGQKAHQLIELHYEKGLSMKQISAQIGISASAAKQAIYRARRALLDCINATAPTAPK